MRNVSVEGKLPVVVGVDDVPDGLQAVDVAAAEAARRGVPLGIVHAWPGRRGGLPRLRAVRPDLADGHHLLELAARRVRHVLPELPVWTELLDAGAAEALIERSEQAGLLVVNHRDDAGPGHGWGSTAAYVAHHSRCPLLVARGPSASGGPVVVVTSGRPTATVNCAYEAAVGSGSPLVAVHVRTSGGFGADAGDFWREAGCATGSADVAVERLLISEAEVAYTLDRASRRGRLLVAGRGRKGWFVEMFYRIGNLSAGGRRLCPVLLVPPGWAATGLVDAVPAAARAGRLPAEAEPVPTRCGSRGAA